MLFIIYWSVPASNRTAVLTRFAETGGHLPDGLTILGRWHDVADGSGVTICEASDTASMARWALQWNDLMKLEVRPALTDEQMGALLVSG